MKDTKGKKPLYIPEIVVREILNKNTHSVWARVFRDIVNPDNIHDIIESLSEVNEIREYGIAKYGDPDNWMKVPKEEYVSAFWRHMNSADQYDQESGLLHRSHTLCNVVFLVWFEVTDETDT